MNTTTRLEMRRVDDLVPYARNARTHSEEQIAQLRASLREFGFVAPMLIDEDGNVLAGHGRLMAAKAEGVVEVPCVLVEHLTEVQRKAYILADNRLAENAAWDIELVSLELQELQEAGFSLDITGFDEENILLDDPGEAYEDDFDEEPPEKPVCKRGQVWKLGRHRVMVGDSTSHEDVQKLMGNSAGNLLLTDPPYNVDYHSESGMSIENDKMSNDSFREFLRAALNNAVDVLEPGSSFYIWHADGVPGLPTRQAVHESGLLVRQCLVWVKQSGSLSRSDYHWQYEPCLHGQTDPLKCGDNYDSHESCLYGWKDGKKHLWCSDRKQTTVLEFDRPTKNSDHPTMKPVRLFAYQIANSTLPDANVLDLFGGSGTTVIACEELGRNAFVMEYDPKYADVIIRRWETMTGEKAVLLDAT